MSPDGSPKLPPEEKLLRLIREKSLKPAVAAATEGASVVAAPTVVLMRPTPAGRQASWLQAAIAALGVALVAEAGWLVWQVLRPAPSLVTTALELPVTVTSVESPAAAAIALPSLAAGATRPLFALPARESGAGEAEARPAHAASQAAKELAARLSLNGIMGGESPQAIIEDTESKKTYFASIGQLVGEAVLEEVSEEQKRVILDFNGEKIELAL